MPLASLNRKLPPPKFPPQRSRLQGVCGKVELQRVACSAYQVSRRRVSTKLLPQSFPEQNLSSKRASKYEPKADPWRPVGGAESISDRPVIFEGADHHKAFLAQRIKSFRKAYCYQVSPALLSSTRRPWQRRTTQRLLPHFSSFNRKSVFLASFSRKGLNDKAAVAQSNYKEFPAPRIKPLT